MGEGVIQQRAAGFIPAVDSATKQRGFPMPIYLYEEIAADGSGGEQHELFQSMSASAYDTHPDTGVPIRRIFGVPNAPKTWTDSQGKAKTSDKNLERLGFTKYVKSADGKYEKTLGKGPSKLSKPPAGA